MAEKATRRAEFMMVLAYASDLATGQNHHEFGAPRCLFCHDAISHILHNLAQSGDI